MRLTASLDWVEVCGLDERITLLDIAETPPALSFRTEDRPAAPGAAVTGGHIGQRLVSLTLSVRERVPARRQRLLDRLLRWARGRELRLSTRPGRFLAVRCVYLPQTAALGWTEAVCLTFAAMECPFWLSEEAITLTASGAAWSGVFTAEGTAPCPVEAEISPVSAAVERLSLSVGDTALRFENLGLGAGETLRLTVEDGWLLRLAVTGANGLERSLSGCVAPASDDLLLAAPGRSAAMFSADAPVNVALSARGCWL